MILSFVSTALLFAATVPRPVSATSLPDWTHWVRNGGRYEGLHTAHCRAFHREVEVDGETIGPMLGEIVGGMRFESPAADAGDIVGKAKYDLPMGDLNSNICTKDFAKAMMINCWTAGVRLGLTQEPHIGELQAIRPPEGVQYCSMKFWFRLFKDFRSSLAADYVPQCLKISMNCALMGFQFPMHACVSEG